MTGNQIEKRLKERGHSNPQAGTVTIMDREERLARRKERRYDDEGFVDGDIFDPYDIAAGDYIDFGSYGNLFVLKAPMEGSLWVTNKRADRYDSNASGWYIRRNFAKGIIEEA